MHFRQAILRYSGLEQRLEPNKSNSFDALFVDFRITPAEAGATFAVFLHPKQSIKVEHLELQFDLQINEAARIFSNGFQSASESRFYGFHEAIPELHWVKRKSWGLSGDDNMPEVVRGKGYVHSWSYMAVEEPDKAPLFLASLNEHTGLTLFQFDAHNAILSVKKVMHGLELAHSFPALHGFYRRGDLKQSFRAWAENAAFRLSKPEQAFMSVSGKAPEAAQCIQDLEYLSALRKKQGNALRRCYYQFSSGWEKAVGDWLHAPANLQNILKDRNNPDVDLAIWIAPFVAEEGSELVNKNPGWLLRSPKGQLLKVPCQSGKTLLALDPYHKGLRDYLSGFFHIATQKWGIKLFEADFLYVATSFPPSGKTSGQVMRDALEFLRQQCDSNKLLVSRVPVGSSLGIADYLRPGAEGIFPWESRSGAFWGRREREGVRLSLINMLHAWPLRHAGMELSAPAFTLGHKPGGLTANQQHSVLLLSVLLGQLIHCGVSVSQMDAFEQDELAELLSFVGSEIQAVYALVPDCYAVYFKHDAEDWVAFVNLRPKPVRFSEARLGNISLEAYESLVLRNSK